MKDIDPDKVIYTRPYIPKWLKVSLILTMGPAILFVMLVLLTFLAVAVAAL